MMDRFFISIGLTKSKSNTPFFTLLALKVHDVYIVINHGDELKEKAPPSIWFCMFRK